MEARVGTLAVGTQFDTLLTGRRGVVRAPLSDGEVPVRLAGLGDVGLHPDVRVKVVEVTY